MYDDINTINVENIARYIMFCTSVAFNTSTRLIRHINVMAGTTKKHEMAYEMTRRMDSSWQIQQTDVL